MIIPRIGLVCVITSLGCGAPSIAAPAGSALALDAYEPPPPEIGASFEESPPPDEAPDEHGGHGHGHHH